MTEAQKRTRSLLARCRMAGIRVVLFQGCIFAGIPAGNAGAGLFGWLPAPPRLQAEIDRCEAEIRAILGDTGSARPWSVEAITGDCLLYYAPFGVGGITPKRRRNDTAHDARQENSRYLERGAGGPLTT